MWKSLALALLLSHLILSLSVSVASAIELIWGMDLSEAYHINESYLQRDDLELIDDLHFSNDRHYNLIQVQPSLTIAAAKGVSAYLRADFSWQTPVEEDEGDELAADLTTAYLSLRGRKISTDIGLQPVQFGNSLILADDTLAANIQANMGEGYATLTATQVMDNSPMVGLALGYRPSYLERFEIFGIWFRDRDDAFAHTAPFVYQVFFDLSSEGDLYYYGAATKVFIGDSLLSVVGAYQAGNYSIDYRTVGNQSGGNDFNVQAYFGDVSLHKNLTDWCTAELFCFFASGDDKPFNRDVEAFVSITPYNPRAAIFFNPDFMDINTTERVTFSGGFFGGVVAPGLGFTLVSSQGVTAEAALIYLQAQQALDDGSQWYGWEVDFALSYEINPTYQLVIEAARFEHGDYYESVLDEKLDPAMRLTVGLRATF